MPYTINRLKAQSHLQGNLLYRAHARLKKKVKILMVLVLAGQNALFGGYAG